MPSYGKLRNLDAASRASVQVLPGVGLAPPFSPSQGCVPPDGVVMFRGPDRIGAS